jgi:hypothetical protein
MFLRRVIAISTLCLSTLVATGTTTAATGCAADADGSGGVTAADISFVVARGGTADPRADLNGNGIVGGADAQVVAGWLGRSCPFCAADLDGDGNVDLADRPLLEAAFGLDCRTDLDHNGVVGESDREIVEISLGLTDPDADPRADVDGNGVVNINDLIRVSFHLGRDCRADLNRDGLVDTLDVFFLLESLGACP